MASGIEENQGEGEGVIGGEMETRRGGWGRRENWKGKGRGVKK